MLMIQPMVLNRNDVQGGKTSQVHMGRKRAIVWKISNTELFPFLKFNTYEHENT